MSDLPIPPFPTHPSSHTIPHKHHDSHSHTAPPTPPTNPTKPPTPPQSLLLHPLVLNFCSGTIGGFMGIVAGHPFDTIKVSVGVWCMTVLLFARLTIQTIVFY